MTDNTIAQVVKDELCTGCGTCIALCPEEAIKLTINEKKGIYIPELDEKKCDGCGICYKVCPGHEIDFKKLNLEIFGKEPEDILIGNYLNCYVGHSTNYDIRYNSASGGLITQLLIFALEEGIIDGALVTRMKKDKPLEPEPFIARTREEIIEASKSKYCPVPANIALKEILGSEEGEKFAVVGLPCHIHGIRKAEVINKKLKERIVLHLGLFCCLYGFSFLGSDFILQKMHIKQRNIKGIVFRSGNFPPGTMLIETVNGGTKKINHHDFMRLVHSRFSPQRCRLCCDATCELADIAFGSDLSGNINETVCVSRTIFGERALQCVMSKKEGNIKCVDKRRIIQLGGTYTPLKKHDLRGRMFLFRLFDKKIPFYNLEFPNLRRRNILLLCLDFILSYFLEKNQTFKRCFWSIFDKCISFGIWLKKLCLLSK